MPIRSLLPILSVVANLATVPALAGPAPQPAAAETAERTLQQNRRVALPRADQAEAFRRVSDEALAHMGFVPAPMPVPRLRAP